MSKGEFSTAIFSDKQWLFTLGDIAPLIEKLDHFPIKLATVAHLFVGLQTDADDVFILEEIRQDKNKVLCKSEATGKEHWFENQHLKPFLKGSLNIRRYYFSDVTKRLIFPYGNKDKKISIISAGEYAHSFPLTWAYLQENKDRLAARNKGKMTEEWHGYIYKKNHGRFSAPKLLVPSLATGSCFASDTEGNYYFVGSGGGGGGGYGITINDDKKVSYPYLLGVLNSSLLSFYLKVTSTPYQGGYIALNRQYIDQLPIKIVDPKNKREARLEKEIVEHVEAIQAAHKQRLKLPDALYRKVAHSQNRTPCNLAHYLQKNFAAAVKPEILIDDVQRTGFVHEIRLESNGNELTFTATVVDAAGSARVPRAESGVAPDSSVGQSFRRDAENRAPEERAPQPILRLHFKDDALRQFIYASWRQFLDANSRKKKWTTGKKPEPIYPLLVNTLEPMVYFSTGAGDNLRAIHDLMKTVAAEAGSADLAAIEAEINKLDIEIDRRVYELYGLTDEEIKIVEGTTR